jgi:asparagine N-glycosylation enzyme membrane subunit Stt3
MSESRSQPSWMLVLSYLAFFGFIPLLAGKEHRNVRWHAINGLLLFAAVVAFGAVATVVGILVPPLS